MLQPRMGAAGIQHERRDLQGDVLPAPRWLGSVWMAWTFRPFNRGRRQCKALAPEKCQSRLFHERRRSHQCRAGTVYEVVAEPRGRACV